MCVCVCVCVLIALVIQHVKRMRRIIWSFVIWLYLIFFTLSYKRFDFRKRVIEHEMRVLILSTNLSETFLILKRIKRDIIVNVHTYSWKVLVIRVRF